MRREAGVTNGGSELPSRSRIQSRLDALLPQGDGRRTERRSGDRRRQRVRVSTERRLRPERRGPLPRRENAAGHFINAAQLLTLAAADPPASNEYIDGALRRLWLGIREMERGNIGWPVEAGSQR
jgi:hypothetical protein